MRYDEAEAVLQADIAPEALKEQRVSLSSAGAGMNQARLDNAALSGFINFRGGMDYVHESAGEEGRAPARLDTDGAINVKGWVLEGRVDYLEDSDRPWQRDDFRLVHDWPEHMVRFAAGDLSYPVTGFQSYQPMLGVSFARNFLLQPYRVTEPTGQSAFLLTSPSRVDVIVNGQRVRTLQLEAGPYDLSDFPVSEGANDIELLITDAAGNVERKRFDMISDQKLLKAGLHEYAYNIGVESENADRAFEYHEDMPVFSGFHRYGITDSLTAGISLQVDADMRQAGFSAVSAQTIGTFGLETAVSHGAEGADGAARLTYQYADSSTRRQFAAAMEYRGGDFGALNADESANRASFDFNARYTQPIAYDVTFGAGGRYRIMRGDTDDQWSYSVNFSKAIYGSLSANLTWQHRSIDGAGMFVGLTWSPHQSDHTLSSSIDTLSQTQDLNWTWREGRRWQAGAGITREDRRLHKTGNMAYAGYRGEASLFHDIITTLAEDGGGRSQGMTERRSNLRVGTAIAFADDHVALSRPIQNGFVLLGRHENLKGHGIGINPEEEDGKVRDYQARIDAVGPAVLPDAVPYMYRPVKIDTGGLPDMYDIGPDNFVAMPTYKGGAVAVIGSAANIYADGYLAFQDGKPAAMQGGIIRSDDGTEQEFFTNKEGRFRISRLSSGEHRLVLNDYPGLSARLEIPADAAAGKFAAGILTVAK